MLNLGIIILVALLFSAFFSGMEIAFTTSNKLKLEIDKKNNRTFDYIASLFMRHPGQYITTILVGNNIALVIYSLYMSKLLSMLVVKLGYAPSDVSIILDTLISTIIIIFTAEFIPKTIIKLNPNFYLGLFIVPVYFFYMLLYPVAKVSTWISIFLLRICGLHLKRNHHIKNFDRIDLEHLLEEVAENEGELDAEQEIKLFQNALDFSDLRVRDCMIPRIDMEAVDAETSIQELSQQFVATQYSRILVYDETIDNIIGYVNAKSLFRNPQTIKQVMMKVDYVPESMSAQRLLEDFIRKRSSIAVVIDEFGGTAGLVSMEDVLEEIFGDIEDEHDSKEGVEKVLGEGEYLLSCRLEVDYLNEKYNLDIPESDDYDTLAGFIIYNFEGIPSQGDEITIGDKRIRVIKKSQSKLELVRLKVI